MASTGMAPCSSVALISVPGHAHSSVECLSRFTKSSLSKSWLAMWLACSRGLLLQSMELLVGGGGSVPVVIKWNAPAGMRALNKLSGNTDWPSMSGDADAGRHTDMSVSGGVANSAWA